jgi:hypothetical protein
MAIARNLVAAGEPGVTSRAILSSTTRRRSALPGFDRPATTSRTTPGVPGVGSKGPPSGAAAAAAGRAVPDRRVFHPRVDRRSQVCVRTKPLLGADPPPGRPPARRPRPQAGLAVVLGHRTTAEHIDRLWQAFLRSFDLEHTFRLFKQTLGWSSPKIRTPQSADTWTCLVIAAHAQLRLARHLAADLRRPWERPAPPGRLTPARVRRGLRNIRATIGTPASAPKRTRSPSGACLPF